MFVIVSAALVPLTGVLGYEGECRLFLIFEYHLAVFVFIFLGFFFDGLVLEVDIVS